MIGLDEALDRLLEGIAPVPAETVPLDRLDQRVLAAPILAGHDQPAERRSLMDGIAVRGAGPQFHLVGSSAAGFPFGGGLDENSAILIATGAVVPGSAERVVPKEMIEVAGDTVSVPDVTAARFIREAGSDFRSGNTLLDAGLLLDPAKVALIAAANRADAEVVGRPRLVVMTAGDELVPPGTPLAPGGSIDSASFAVALLARRWGADVVRAPAIGDELEATIAALRAHLDDAELVVTIGGASVGTRDHMRPAALALDGEMRFERINLQPGKPCWHARVAENGLILGLPGNPSSAYVCAHLLLRPLLMRLGGRRADLPMITAMLDGPLKANGPREQFVRAVRSSKDDQPLRLRPLADQDSGLQAMLAHATHLVRQAPNAAGSAPGTPVEAIALEA